MLDLRQLVLVMMTVRRLPVDVVLVQLILFQLPEGWTFENETFETRARREEIKISIFFRWSWREWDVRVQLDVNPNFPQIAFWMLSLSHTCARYNQLRLDGEWYPFSSNLLFQCVSEDLLCLPKHRVRFHFNAAIRLWFNLRRQIPPQTVSKHLDGLEQSPKIIGLDNDALEFEFVCDCFCLRKFNAIFQSDGKQNREKIVFEIDKTMRISSREKNILWTFEALRN